jgi:hypothetical protein
MLNKIRTPLARVARWYSCKPKIWVHFVGSCNSRCWYLLCPFGLFFGLFFGLLWCHLVCLWSFGVYIPLFGMLDREKSGNPAAGAVCFTSCIPTLWMNNRSVCAWRKCCVQKSSSQSGYVAIYFAGSSFKKSHGYEKTRVTRLGKFSPIGWLFSLCGFWKFQKLRKFMALLFPEVSVLYLFWQKNGLGYILGDFFTNWSGHLGKDLVFLERRLLVKLTWRKGAVTFWTVKGSRPMKKKKCWGPFLTSPLGANFDSPGRSCPPGVNFVPQRWSYPLGVKLSVHPPFF